MTCVQFEKQAGRELSKKWKESIHILDEPSTGFHGSLITWLQRQAAYLGEQVFGLPCWIRWCRWGGVGARTPQHTWSHFATPCPFTWSHLATPCPFT